MQIILVSSALLGALLCSARPSDPGNALARVKRGHEHSHEHSHATSYQNFNLESYHPVPVYKKHEEHSYHEPLHKSSDFELSGDLASFGSHGHDEGLGHLSLSEGHDSSSFLDEAGASSYGHLAEADDDKEGHGY